MKLSPKERRKSKKDKKAKRGFNKYKKGGSNRSRKIKITNKKD